MSEQRPVILWIEDNTNDVVLVRQAFTELGLEIDLVVSPNAVLAFKYMDAREPYQLRKNPPDLILVDLNLPGINGMVVLNEIHKHTVWSKAPVVVLTSSTNPKELDACRTLGARECVTKPATFGGYLDVIKSLRKYWANGPHSPKGKLSEHGGTQTDLTPTKLKITDKAMDDLSKPENKLAADAG